MSRLIYVQLMPKISTNSLSGAVADDSIWLVFVNCVDTPKVHSVTNGALEDTEAMFFPDSEAVETTIDLERIIDTCYGYMPMFISKNKSVSIIPFLTFKLP